MRVEFQTSFADFKRLQTYMAGRVFRMNKRGYAVALVGVVLCAISLTTAIIINVHPYIAMRYFGGRYPESVYLSLILCLAVALLFLIPGVRLRKKSLRMQVTDDGPLFGATVVSVQPEGLHVDRKLMKATYMWSGVQAVEDTSKALVIAIDNGIGVIIPHSAFATDAAKYEFLAGISEKIEAARKRAAH